MSARIKKNETSGFTVKKFSPRRTRRARSSEISSSRTLRVLRDLRGEQLKLIVTHFSPESLKNQKNRRRAFAALSFLSLRAQLKLTNLYSVQRSSVETPDEAVLVVGTYLVSDEV